ncbi:protein RGF1 INDUCIBLE TRANSCRIPTION FACTOR 1-like [Primulina tabacum]|uniref:protein RGF1 INDUCIBLE TRANSCRIPTION FACTOR 1-like n=1 Tax=Primulina tabacum TaxID=48773 RepID=UPI003F5A5FD0
MDNYISLSKIMLKKNLDTSEVPRWLLFLLKEKFFNACIIHEEAKRNEKNVFCLDCCDGICPHCLIHHRSHRLLQIRRYVYHDVIRLADADKLMDCGKVQSYTTNSAKVVFLNHRPQTRPCRVSGSLCITCDRNLQESYLFCSVSCKLKHMLESGCNLSMYLRKCEFLALPEMGLDDGGMIPESVLEPDGSVKTDYGSSSDCDAGTVGCLNLSSSATTEIVRKKRSNPSGIRSGLRPGCGPVSEMSDAIINRRKGTPHRSPLY